jgi:hypothetical protein
MLDGIMGTLDQQVDDKKSMMRANPGMQGTVGKDLIGVMALQKLQKEKQAAENELMLAQQNNPATIKEQLENELAGMTQNEMTAQTAGIMNQRQQQKQQQQQRPPQQQRPQGIQQAARPPMGGAPRPPMGGAPRPPMGAPKPPMGGAGIAGAPRPPMMAQGGIVGFREGGLNDQQRRAKEYQESKGGFMVQALTEALKRKGLTRQQFEALPPAEKQAIRATLPQVTQELKQERDNYMSPMARLKDATSPQALEEKRDNARKQLLKKNNPDLFAQQYPDEVKPNTADVDTSALSTGNTITTPKVEDMAGQGVLKPGQQFASDATTTTTPTTAPQAGTGSDLASLLKEKMNTEPTSDQLGTIGKSQATDRLDSGIKTTLGSMSKGADPQSAMKAAQAAGDERYNKDYDVEGIKAKRQAQDDEIARQLTPEALQEQRLRAGAVQRGGLAGARAISGNRADARRMQMFKDSADNYAADMKANVEKLKAVDSTAARIMEQVAADRRVAIDVFSKLSIADQQAVTADKDRFQKQNETAVESLLKGMKIESEATLMRSIQDSKDSAELRSTWEALRETRSDAIDAYLASNEYLMLDDDKKPAARAQRTISITSRFENLETEIIRQLQALNPNLDYSAFLEKNKEGPDTMNKDTGAADDILKNL